MKMAAKGRGLTSLSKYAVSLSYASAPHLRCIVPPVLLSQVITRAKDCHPPVRKGSIVFSLIFFRKRKIVEIV